MARMTNEQELQASLQEIWYLKDVKFKNKDSDSPKRYRIITQNFNGVADPARSSPFNSHKGNILILRGDIEILPADRPSVSYEQLSQLLAEYLLRTCPDVDISSALTTMPVTRKGMDLNPLFTGVTSFRPAVSGGELELFEYADIKLVHGWLVDPSSPEFQAVSQVQDYDTALNLIAEADHISKGQLVTNPQSPSASGQQAVTLTLKESDRVTDAITVRSFLDSTPSQLTYYGLFAIASALEPGALVALFRNSHLSVLYKSPNPDDSALYILATDQVFLRESSVVWERLEDVDGGWSTFVDSDFVRSTPVGGDYAGHTAESALAALEGDMGAMTLEERADLELAQQLQVEENQRAQAMRAERHRREAEEEQERKLKEMTRQAREAHKKERKGKKGDCVIM